MIDFTWNIGVIVQITVLVLGGWATLVTLRNTVATIKTDMAATKKENDKRFDGIQNELRKLGDILVSMARFDEKLSNLDKRVTAHGRRIDELSHGEGFVRGNFGRSIDKEYD
jgi:hypothetical protein